MNAQPAAHPSAATLQAFGQGRLKDALLAESILQHVETCGECRKKVIALSGDSFLQRMRDARQRSSAPIPTPAPSDVGRAIRGPPLASTTPAVVPGLPPELEGNPEYEILRELGKGGMGVVYLARNKAMDRLEVLKVVNKAVLDRPGAIERFQREIRSAAKLNHPNIVIAYHAPQLGNLLVFAMEYVPGENLAEVIKNQGGPLPVLNACYYVQQAVLGLQHAFEKGMVHRDIKPQNLILAKDGKRHIVKILDFGLAKARSEKKADYDLTGEGKMLGTPDYIAPEQMMDAASAHIRADICSLGCTLYFLLAGRPPFQGRSLLELLQAHQSAEAKPLNQVRSDVAPGLAAVVAKMMAKAPEQRYQTPLELAQAILPFLKVEGKRTSPSPAATGSRPPMPAPGQFKDTAEVTTKADRQEAVRPGQSTLTPDGQSPATQTAKAVAVNRMAKRRWLLLAGGGAVVILVLSGLWAAGVFQEGIKDRAGQPESPSPDRGKATLYELLQPGSVWRGEALQIKSREKLRLTIKITERIDGTLYGTYTTVHKDGRRFQWAIAGEVDENKVHWQFTECMTKNHRDSMDGCHVTGKFDGTKLSITLGSNVEDLSVMWVKLDKVQQQIGPDEKRAVRIVSSWFKEGNDGWTTKNEDESTDATTPPQLKQYKGFYYLTATDVNPIREWGWHAPAQYRGDHSDKFGRLLKYSIWVSQVGNQPQTDWWVRLRGDPLCKWLRPEDAGPQ